MAGSKLPRDRRENIRLGNIAFYLSELKRLRKLMAEYKEEPEEVLDLLYEARIIPVTLLEELGVDRLTPEAVFTFDGLITPDFLESFRKTGSRKFWE